MGREIGLRLLESPQDGLPSEDDETIEERRTRRLSGERHANGMDQRPELAPLLDGEGPRVFLQRGGELWAFHGAFAGRMRDVILSAGDVAIDYVALVDPDTLEPVERIDGPTLAAVAVRIANTRLIDNELLVP